MAPPVVNKIYCNGCSQEIVGKQFLKCNICSKHYDLLCTSVSEKRFHNIMSTENKNKWKCQECISKEPKTDNTNTPIKYGLQQSPKSNDEETCSTNVTLRNRTHEKQKTQTTSVPASDMATAELANELRLLRQDIKEMRNDMQDFRGTIESLFVAINSCNKRLDCLEARMEVVEKNQHIKPSNDVSLLENTIADLKMEINDRDQELLCNDVEIAGIPEEKSERSIHLVLAVATKLGVSLEERDIVSAERAGPLRREPADIKNTKPRPIVARLARRTHRDCLLAAARVRRNSTTAGLGLDSGTCPLYLNERLTKYNRQLFYKARFEAKRVGWKYVWTREGKVFARKDNGELRYRLRFESDLAKVFGH
ncbi:unnamed protein product [Parnassius mnemosyne]|uniref:FP protein C-terminal domain-containing protein n=1 Tax=Parnassius mnemosyne TaxID=213953 RepID=A0AAV1KFR8_9NEOP